MNTAIILAGGVGSRMNTDNIPKQYIQIKDRRIIDYCLNTFQKHPLIDRIVIAADPIWVPMIDESLSRFQVDKFIGYSNPGITRQFSIFHALQLLEDNTQDTDMVIIHDAARPLVSPRLITECLSAAEHYDGVMPVLPVKDTLYRSKNKKEIFELLPREELFAGQAPESFRYGKYLECHYQMNKEEMMTINGSSEIAYKNHMNILLIPGEERNFKITTNEDLELLNMYLEKETINQQSP